LSGHFHVTTPRRRPYFHAFDLIVATPYAKMPPAATPRHYYYYWLNIVQVISFSLTLKLVFHHS